MNKTKKFIITIALVLSILLSNIMVLNSSAEVNVANNYWRIHTSVINSYASKYYSRLINYFGYNKYDTCIYIAIGMLLTYYDCFRNDNFVQDQYIVKS